MPYFSGMPTAPDSNCWIGEDGIPVKTSPKVVFSPNVLVSAPPVTVGKRSSYQECQQWSLMWTFVVWYGCSCRNETYTFPASLQRARQPRQVPAVSATQLSARSYRIACNLHSKKRCHLTVSRLHRRISLAYTAVVRSAPHHACLSNIAAVYSNVGFRYGFRPLLHCLGRAGAT